MRMLCVGTCDTKCADYQEIGAITVFGIIAVLIVWIVINKSASGECVHVFRMLRLHLCEPI